MGGSLSKALGKFGGTTDAGGSARLMRSARVREDAGADAVSLFVLNAIDTNPALILLVSWTSICALCN